MENLLLYYLTFFDYITAMEMEKLLLYYYSIFRLFMITRAIRTFSHAFFLLLIYKTNAFLIFTYYKDENCN